MKIKQIYSPRPDGPLRLAGFMSGSGTNLVKIVQYERRLAQATGQKPYEVVLIFTDNAGSNAEQIADRFGIPFVVHDIMDFYKTRGHDTKKDLSLRPDFDSQSIEKLDDFSFDLIALAGYMSIVTRPLLSRFNGRIVNVHPADLTVTKDGKRLYTGDHAVALAMKNGEQALFSSTHIVREQVDYGEILMVSEPVPVTLPEGVTTESLNLSENRPLLNELADAHQDRLKEMGDWVIFPRTIELIAQGRFGISTDGAVFFDDQPVPRGHREYQS